MALKQAGPRTMVGVVAIALLLSACSYRSGTTYSPDEAGVAMQVSSARVVSAREVNISGLDNREAAGWGTAIGAGLAGTAAYGLSGADNPAGVAITVIAAIVGGLVGLAAEEYRETRRGAEYVLDREGGQTVAIVQSLGGNEAIFPAGTQVSLIKGSRGFYRVGPSRGR